MCSRGTLPTLFAGCDQSVSDLRQTAERAVSEAGQQTESGGLEAGGSTATQSVTVVRATDDDTVEIEPAVRGRTDLRLIGVDSPELDSSRPLSQEAADFTASRLEGQKVRLTLGPDAVDPYDRLLGTVKRQGESRTHGAALLDHDYAQTLWYEPNTGYRPLYEDLQNVARQKEAGIWGVALEERCELAGNGSGIGENRAECT